MQFFTQIVIATTKIESDLVREWVIRLFDKAEGMADNQYSDRHQPVKWQECFWDSFHELVDDHTADTAAMVQADCFDQVVRWVNEQERDAYLQLHG